MYRITSIITCQYNNKKLIVSDAAEYIYSLTINDIPSGGINSKHIQTNHKYMKKSNMKRYILTGWFNT